MSVKVQWIPYISQQNGLEANISYIEPENAFSFYKKTREDSRAMLCPSIAGYLKNCFVIRSPYEITLEYNHANKTLATDRYGDEFANGRMYVEGFENSPTILHLFPQYLFLANSKKPVHIEVLPMLFEFNKFAVIPGTFDVAKWLRPIEFALEVYTDCKLEIKRETPLFMVRFVTEDNDTIILEQGIQTQEVYNAFMSCYSTKLYNPKMNLTKLYKMAEGYMNIMKRKIFGD